MKGIFFDLDGTLCDTIEDLAYSTNAALKMCGCPLHSVETYKMFVGNGMQKQIERALGKENLEHFEDCCQKFIEHYQEHCFDHTKSYEGMNKVLDELKKKGYKLAVITNKPHSIALKIVNALFPNTFDVIYGGSQEYPKKPDITSTKKAMHDLHLKNNEIYFVGDSYVDMETGKNAAIKTIGCVWGFRGEKELQDAGATYLAYQPLDILEIINDCD